MIIFGAKHIYYSHVMHVQTKGGLCRIKRWKCCSSELGILPIFIIFTRTNRIHTYTGRLLQSRLWVCSMQRFCLYSMCEHKSTNFRKPKTDSQSWTPNENRDRRLSLIIITITIIMKLDGKKRNVPLQNSSHTAHNVTRWTYLTLCGN